MQPGPLDNVPTIRKPRGGPIPVFEAPGPAGKTEVCARRLGERASRLLDRL
jgi:hypothetical protein